MSGAAIAWSSAIAPEAPPIPRQWHWLAGVALGALALTLVSLRYADAGEALMIAEEEAVVISLGGQARRLDPPPPEVETSEEAPQVAERADDAPPPAAPVEPRVVAGSAEGEGRASSGTGGGASGPPAPLPPPPPPPPPRPTAVSQRFVEISIREYSRQIIYPKMALDREQEGQGVLRVQIARDGSVLDWKLIRSTGHAQLDREIQRVARRVRRLDPLPANFAYDTTKVEIPITFTIEYFDPQ